jgi:hypothetical protein
MSEAEEHIHTEEHFTPFSVKACHIVNQEGLSNNITGIVVGFHLYESINSAFLTGDMIVVDGVNILKHFRFTGQEFIRLSLAHGAEDDMNPGKVIDMTFRVYKMTNVLRANEITQTYKLNFCDPAMFIANTTRISKVYRGSYSDMLFSVVNNGISIPTSDIDHWEKTESDNNQFVCPNWKANTLIKHFVSNADKGTNSSWRNGMFFYQTMATGYNFKSIDQMCSGETTLDFRKDGESLNTVHEFLFKPSASAADQAHRNQIFQVRKPQIFDTLLGTIAGAYASRSKTYDSVRKLEEDNYYDIEDTFNRGTHHVSEYPIIRTESMLTISEGQERGLTTENPQGDDFPPVMTVPHQTQLAPNLQQDNYIIYDYTPNHDFDNGKDVSSDEVFVGNKITDNSKLERLGLKQILEQNRIEVIVPVRTDVSVGNIVQLHIPEPEIQDDTAQTKDRINDNRYLIVDICLSANIQKGTGSLQLECVKESYAKQISLETLDQMIASSSPPTNIDMEAT